jgi:hypothetical protein
MSLSTSIETVFSNGVQLDTAPDKFGELLDSSDIAFDGPALRERMKRDGYLYLPGLLNRDEVLEARHDVAQR